jgi:hypothetical protein
MPGDRSAADGKRRASRAARAPVDGSLDVTTSTESTRSLQTAARPHPASRAATTDVPNGAYAAVRRREADRGAGSTIVVVASDDRRPLTRARWLVRSPTPAEAGVYGLVPPDGGGRSCATSHRTERDRPSNFSRRGQAFKRRRADRDTTQTSAVRSFCRRGQVFKLQPAGTGLQTSKSR